MLSVATPTMWFVFIAIVAFALFVDFVVLNRQGAHRVEFREAAIWSLVWVAVSLAYMGVMWWELGGTSGDPILEAKASESAMAYLTGYMVEKALAVDNIFVFLMVFTYFSVPPQFQKRALMFGVLGALILRTVLILIGAWLISSFHWILYVFGAFLLFTGVKMWIAADQEPDLTNNPALSWIRKRFRIANDFDGEKFFTQENGLRVATPLFVVVALIGIVDVVFAVDSIPAIFAITTDPFIVLTSNVFAILGLRAMYFLLADLKERFHLLPYGLAVVLVFVGTKMLLLDIYHIPMLWSLLITVSILTLTIILSVVIKPTGTHAPGAYPFTAKVKPSTQDKPDSQ